MERLIICGGGHVSLALAHMASILDFDITVIDDREENGRFASTRDLDRVEGIGEKKLEELLPLITVS